MGRRRRECRSSLALANAGVALDGNALQRALSIGAGALGGIGFTAALFIASLAFDSVVLQDDAKIGILIGSLVSGLVGVTLLGRGHVNPVETPERLAAAGPP